MRNILLLITLAYCTQSFAQPKIGIAAGLNLPWQHYKVTYPSFSQKVKYDMITSFHAGLISEFAISDRIKIQPGLQVAGKGGQISSQASNNTIVTRKISLYYIEAPLVVNYNIPVKKNKAFIGAGPSLAYGFSGKDKQTYFTNDVFENEFKKFDAALRMQAGFRVQNLQLTAIYNLGLVNIYNNDLNNMPIPQKVNWKNDMLGLSVAYFLD